MTWFGLLCTLRSPLLYCTGARTRQNQKNGEENITPLYFVTHSAHVRWHTGMRRVAIAVHGGAWNIPRCVPRGRAVVLSEQHARLTTLAHRLLHGRPSSPLCLSPALSDTFRCPFSRFFTPPFTTAFALSPSWRPSPCHPIMTPLLPSTLLRRSQLGVEVAARAGHSVLSAGGSAMDAVEVCVCLGVLCVCLCDEHR